MLHFNIQHSTPNRIWCVRIFFATLLFIVAFRFTTQQIKTNVMKMDETLRAHCISQADYFEILSLRGASKCCLQCVFDTRDKLLISHFSWRRVFFFCCHSSFALRVRELLFDFIFLYLDKLAHSGWELVLIWLTTDLFDIFHVIWCMRMLKSSRAHAQPA